MFRRRTVNSTDSPVREFAEGKILHAGTLLKRGRVNTSLKQRYFVLMERKLYYSRGPDQKPIDFIPLDQAVIRPAVDHVNEDFAFEIVTDKSSRVFLLVASSQQDMLEWIKLLSQQTRLNKENHLIEQAEDMIAKATYLQARSEEEREHEQVKEEIKARKSPSPANWMGRVPSSSSLSMTSSGVATMSPPSPQSEGGGLYRSDTNFRIRKG